MENQTKNTTKLTRKQLEHLALYFMLMKNTYYFMTNKKLNTAEEILELIESDTITFEDIFDVYFEDRFTKYGDDEDERYWEDNMHKFTYENYFPQSNKNVEDGAWIKIRNENGFEIHYAKKSSRKRRYDEEYERIVQQILMTRNKSIKRLTAELAGSDPILPENVDLTKSQNDKIDALNDEMKELSIRTVIGLPVYEVKINRTKSKTEYYLPYQYELVTDINEFADGYVNGLPGVNAKMLYTAQNKDAVFYLQSRGISKKNAEMLAALQQTYFTVNMHEAMQAYDSMLKERIKFVNK